MQMLRFVGCSPLVASSLQADAIGCFFLDAGTPARQRLAQRQAPAGVSLHRSYRVLRAAAPNFNPQNVPDPQVLPNPAFTPEEAVRAQMDALQDAHKPWTNHGIQTMYEFGYDIGGMERSRYFGMSKDLYHFDHFLGQFQNSFPEVFEMTGYTLKDIEQRGEEMLVLVDINGRADGAPVQLQFLLARQEMGRKKNSYMTKSLKKT